MIQKIQRRIYNYSQRIRLLWNNFSDSFADRVPQWFQRWMPRTVVNLFQAVRPREHASMSRFKAHTFRFLVIRCPHLLRITKFVERAGVGVGEGGSTALRWSSAMVAIATAVGPISERATQARITKSTNTHDCSWIPGVYFPWLNFFGQFLKNIQNQRWRRLGIHYFIIRLTVFLWIIFFSGVIKGRECKVICWTRHGLHLSK